MPILLVLFWALFSDPFNPSFLGSARFGFDGRIVKKKKKVVKCGNKNNKKNSFNFHTYEGFVLIPRFLLNFYYLNAV